MKVGGIFPRFFEVLAKAMNVGGRGDEKVDQCGMQVGARDQSCGRCHQVIVMGRHILVQIDKAAGQGHDGRAAISRRPAPPLIQIRMCGYALPSPGCVAKFVSISGDNLSAIPAGNTSNCQMGSSTLDRFTP